MVTSTQNTTMIFTPRGTACPKSVTQDWLNADPEVHAIIAEIALFRAARTPDNDEGWMYKVLMDVVEAIRDGGALVAQYRNFDGIVSARVLFPESATVTNDGNLTFRAYCTARKTWRTFRVDGVLDCHALTLPCDAQPPHRDAEKQPLTADRYERGHYTGSAARQRTYGSAYAFNGRMAEVVHVANDGMYGVGMLGTVEARY